MMIVSPFVVSYASQVIKVIPVIASAAGWRVSAIRAVVALLSLTGAVLTQVIGGPEVDISLIETTLLTVVNGVAATAIYYFATRKK